MEEATLFEQYRETGDITLRNEIAEKYLYIAAMIARKFTGRGVEYDDLYQVAALALVKGVERFDPTKGVKFSTFITPTVTGEIKNYFRDRARIIHLPRKVSELRAQIRKAAEELTAELGKTPSAREIAARLNISEEEVVRTVEVGQVTSLDRSAYDTEDEDGASLHELLAASDDGGLEAFERRDELEAAMKPLQEAERTLLALRYGEGLSQTETARRMGVSQMYVSRLERKVLAKLKETLKRGLAE